MIFLVLGIIIGSVALCNGIIIGNCKASDIVLLTRYGLTNRVFEQYIDLTITFNSLTEVRIRLFNSFKDQLPSVPL